MVELTQKKTNSYELKDFYRAKDSPADIQIGKNPEVLRRLETKYYAELYWSLDQESQQHQPEEIPVTVDTRRYQGS